MRLYINLPIELLAEVDSFVPKGKRSQFIREAIEAKLESVDGGYRSREAFFEKAKQIAARVDLSPEEAEALAAEAVQSIRNQRRIG